MLYMERRYLDALSFDFWESGSSEVLVKNKATGDVHWCVISVWY